MSHRMPFVVGVLLFVAGRLCAQGDAEAFTRDFIDALRKQWPELTVMQMDSLTVRMVGVHGSDTSTIALDNAFAVYRRDTSLRSEVIAHYVSAYVDGLKNPHNVRVERTALIPMIKSRAWLDGAMDLALRGGKSGRLPFVMEELTSELVIVYGEDTPNTVIFLTEDRLLASGLKRTELRRLASANLMRLLPKIEVEKRKGIYIVEADGTYEASLLLIDSLWTRSRFNVKGDFVVAVPARDVLLVTGSEDADGVALVRRVVEMCQEDTPYPLTRQLHVRRRGRFVPFD